MMVKKDPFKKYEAELKLIHQELDKISDVIKGVKDKKLREVMFMNVVTHFVGVSQLNASLIIGCLDIIKHDIASGYREFVINNLNLNLTRKHEGLDPIKEYTG